MKMEINNKILTMLALLLIMADSVAAGTKVTASPNGIKFPAGYQNWSVISQSHRIDNHTVRVILGNNKAIAAARSGNTNPWPDGAILGKLVWKQKTAVDWAKAIVPDKFVHAEFMFKNASKYAKTGGWGWARWKGMDQKPYGKADVAKECVACHTPVMANDWVFTRPAAMPPVVE